MVERNFDCKFKCAQSNGSEELPFLSSKLKDTGLVHCIQCPHTLEHKGVIESKNWKVIERGLTLWFQASMSVTHWLYDFCTLFYCLNRISTHIFQWKSPYELLYKGVPNYSFLMTFTFFLAILINIKDIYALTLLLVVSIQVDMWPFMRTLFLLFNHLALLHNPPMTLFFVSFTV